jgi:NitT/TauT family transport system substrate-binding protein
MALHNAGAPVTIVAGGGIEGLVLIAQPGLDSPDKLKGKTLGTIQMDTLEVLPYDWFKHNNVSFKDITVRYMGNTPEAVEAFRAGALDVVCTVEPYGSALLNDVKGSVKLSDGTDIYGHGYTDCVLAVRNDLIKQNPTGIKALIKGMMKAQLMAETKPDDVLKILVGPYYKTSMENAKIAMSKQPSVVDARGQTQFILDRVDSLMEMGYIKNKPNRDAIDWTLLEAVIAENKELYGQLKYKAA